MIDFYINFSQGIIIIVLCSLLREFGKWVRNKRVKMTELSGTGVD